MRFEDYHRTVIGFHGTRRSTAEQIVLGKQLFSPSQNNDDWLGHGVYFWEHAPQQAWSWAKRRSEQENWNEEPAVVASMLRLGSCFDLLDPYNLSYLERLYAKYKATADEAKLLPPKNRNSQKYLDCAVFEFSYAAIENDGKSVDSSRAVYVPTGKDKRVWERSWISRETHIQICIRNPHCILGTWLVGLNEDDHAKIPD